MTEVYTQHRSPRPSDEHTIWRGRSKSGEIQGICQDQCLRVHASVEIYIYLPMIMPLTCLRRLSRSGLALQAFFS